MDDNCPCTDDENHTGEVRTKEMSRYRKNSMSKARSIS